MKSTWAKPNADEMPIEFGIESIRLGEPTHPYKGRMSCGHSVGEHRDTSRCESNSNWRYHFFDIQ